jgi:hypothetical protein
MREKFRCWVRTLETFLLQVILQERTDTIAAVARGPLLGALKISGAIIKVRRRLSHQP